MNKIKKLMPFAIGFLPLIVVAKTITDVLNDFSTILDQIIPLLLVLATVIFLWGLVKYMTGAGDEDKVAAGRQLMLWGIIGLFVMVAVWGLVNILISTFGLQGSDIIPSGPKR